MARVLIVGGGERGRWLATQTIADGNAARIVIGEPEGERAVADIGAECWIGDPNRLATIVGALDGVAIACWLLGTTSGPAGQVAELHGSRLEAFLAEAVDSPMRGFVYEAAGTIPAAMLAAGAAAARRLAERNSIPLRTIDVAPSEQEGWRTAALAAVSSLLARG
jgi:hypothetical protein